MKISIVKRIVLKLLNLSFCVCNYISNKFGLLSAYLGIKYEDLNAKWSYQTLYMIGSENELSDAIREHKPLPIKEVQFMWDNGKDTTIYDPEIHKVITTRWTRLYGTREGALEAAKTFTSNRNIGYIVLEQEESVDTAKVPNAEKKVHKKVVSKKNKKVKK